jgi:hypothetical protein
LHTPEPEFLDLVSGLVEGQIGCGHEKGERGNGAGPTADVKTSTKASPPK